MVRMISFISNGAQASQLPRVFHHDFNNPNYSAVSEFDHPVIGEIILLRDDTEEFETMCVVTGTRTAKMAPNYQIAELKQIGDIEYLVPEPVPRHKWEGRRWNVVKP